MRVREGRGWVGRKGKGGDRLEGRGREVIKEGRRGKGRNRWSMVKEGNGLQGGEKRRWVGIHLGLEEGRKVGGHGWSVGKEDRGRGRGKPFTENQSDKIKISESAE